MGQRWRGERRRELRGATARGDGAEIVRLLTETPLDDEVLQLAGDGLVVALRERTEGATELARRCAAALDERGWWGDEELAAQLRAAVDDGPQPLLKPIPIDLDELSSHLEGDGFIEEGMRLDVETGQLWINEDPEGYSGIPAPDHWEDDDRWLSVWAQGSRDGYRDMVRFAEGVEDERLRELLAVALDGKGAFRRFKDVLDRDPELVDAWRAFSEERTHGRARAWLAEEGYRAVPPTR